MLATKDGNGCAEYDQGINPQSGPVPKVWQKMKTVWHVAGLGNYKTVAEEQLFLLHRSGIGSVDLSFCGSGIEAVLFLADKYGVKLRVVSNVESVKACERPAIEHVWELAKSSDEPVLYFHSKGVSRPNVYAKQIMRQVMGETLISQWRANLEHLNQYDAVGCNWWPKGNAHFSGNFWITSAEHIRRLPNPARYCRGNRFKAEQWIGASKKIRPKSLLCQGIRWWPDDFDWRTFLPTVGVVVCSECGRLPVFGSGQSMVYFQKRILCVKCFETVQPQTMSAPTTAIA